MWFQVHYHSPLKGFFPSFARANTGSLSVAREYLALRDGPRQIRDGLSRVPSYSGCQTHSFLPCRLRTGLSPSMVALSRAVPLEYFECLCPVLQPHQDESRWFRLIRFRSPLQTESLLLSFPRGNEMFQFPRSPRTPMDSVHANSGISGSLRV